MHERRFAGPRGSRDGEKLSAFDVQIHAPQCANFDFANDVCLDEVLDGDDARHRRYRPRPPPPPGNPPPKFPPRLPCPCWNGLPAAAAPGRAAVGSTIPVTASVPTCSSPLTTSVFVPSVMPVRRFTGLSCLSMYSHVRPGRSTVASGAKSASIVVAPWVAGAPLPLLFAAGAVAFSNTDVSPP